MKHTDISSAIRQLYAIVNDLEQQNPGRRFTLDGHLIGSIGEALVKEAYGLTLYRTNTPVHDAVAPDGREVQIKATQIDRVSISGKPQHLIVIKILPDGTWEEIYNGPGNLVLSHLEKKKNQKNGQRQISLSVLRALMKEIPEAERIPRI